MAGLGGMGGLGRFALFVDDADVCEVVSEVFVLLVVDEAFESALVSLPAGIVELCIFSLADPVVSSSCRSETLFVEVKVGTEDEVRFGEEEARGAGEEGVTIR